MPKCLALLSGGLDSMLAIRVMQEQGVDVAALTFRTLFTCCQDQAGRAAQWLGVPLTAIAPDDDYLQLIRRPEFGYGRGANPCIDCRIYMFEKAGQLMAVHNADFIVSGEIVGQRPKSQKRRDLDVISHHAQLHDRLLRPLCARRLDPTWPERQGLVDRDRLYDFCGRSRKGLIRLAHQFGFPEIPSPSTGCQLTEPRFSRKVFDLMKHDSANDRWSFELLKYGRHFRYDSQTKFVVGRSEPDNLALAEMHRSSPDGDCALIRPTGFRGPSVLLVGLPNSTALKIAGGLVWRFGKPPSDSVANIDAIYRERTEQHVAEQSAEADALQNVSLIRSRC